jgi:hypothetical protein
MENLYIGSTAFLCSDGGDWMCIIYRSVPERYTLGVNWEERGKNRVERGKFIP